MSDLRSKIIRLAHVRPDLRPHLLPLVASLPSVGPKEIEAKLNVAQKALREVSVREARNLQNTVDDMYNDLEAEWNRPGGGGPATEQQLARFNRLKGEVFKNLKLQGRVALRKGTLFADVVTRKTKELTRLVPPSYLSEVLAQASYLGSAASLSRMKAERAQELVEYYGKWLKFFEANGRAPYFNEQADFVREASVEAPTMAKFEKGKPADPTENMSKEDKAKWEAMTDKHKDQFKKD